jgi:hypothetical protein
MDMAEKEDAFEAGTAVLGRLAAELATRGLEAHLSTHRGRRPFVAVRNPAAPVLTENIVADAEWFWWSWADKIAPTADVAAAAQRIAQVLAAAGESSHA